MDATVIARLKKGNLPVHREMIEVLVVDDHFDEKADRLAIQAAEASGLPVMHKFKDRGETRYYPCNLLTPRPVAAQSVPAPTIPKEFAL